MDIPYIKHEHAVIEVTEPEQPTRYVANWGLEMLITEDINDAFVFGKSSDTQRVIKWLIAVTRKKKMKMVFTLKHVVITGVKEKLSRSTAA